MTLIFLAAFFISYIGVFFKAFQQLNVIHHKVVWVIPCSFVMAACEFFVISQIALTQNYWLIIPFATGAGLGAITSMYFHKYLRGRITNEN